MFVYNYLFDRVVDVVFFFEKENILISRSYVLDVGSKFFPLFYFNKMFSFTFNNI